MTVRIRLKRLGKPQKPCYRIIVIDSRMKRNGRFIEEIGQYAPLLNPSYIEINHKKALFWLKNGAQPSNIVNKLFSIKQISKKNNL